MQVYIHAFTDKCWLYFDFLNIEGVRLLTCLNYIDTLTSLLSVLTRPTTVRLDKGQ